MRRIVLAVTALAMSVIMSMTAFAGTWSQDGSGDWLYKHDDGTLSTNEWVETLGKWYYTGADGKMATNCTVDGYALGSDGAWVTSNSTAKKDEYTRENHYDKDGKLLYVVTYEYENGKKTKMSLYLDDGKLNSTYNDYQYDDKGRCIKSPEYSVGEVLIDSYDIEYDFDEHDNAKKTTTYDINDNSEVFTRYNRYEYDDRGNIIKYTWCLDETDNDGAYYTYEYDENGNRIKTTHITAYDTLSYYQEYQYDAQGNKISSVKYNPDGTVKQRVEYIR